MQEDIDFWAFSLHVYGQTGVADACIRLQDQLAVDVNLVLFAVWVGARGRRLEAEQTRTAVDAVVQWQRDVVQMLRRVRRRLKFGPDPAPNRQTEALREAVKASELAAEKIEQDTLQNLQSTRLKEGPQEEPLIAAVANVVSMLRLTASEALGEAEAGLISAIVKAAIPSASAAVVEDAIAQEMSTLPQQGQCT